MKAIKILFIIPRMDAGGTERQLLFLLKHLDRARFKPYLAILKPGGIFEKKIPPDVPIIAVTCYKRLIKTLFELHRWLKSEQIELIHSFLSTANFFGALLKLLPGNRVLLTSQRGLHTHCFNKWALFDRMAHRIARGIAANSLTVGEHCRNFLNVPPGKLRVIANGVEIKPARDIASYRSEPGQKGLHRFLSIGRFDRLKGHHILVAAAFHLIEKGRPISLDFVGAGVEKEVLLKKVEENPGKAYIRFFETTPDIWGYLVDCDIFLLATFSEGCSNVILEAMAAGKPIITTDIAANRELIDHGEDGLLLPPGDSQAFAGAMEYLMEHPVKAAQLGRNARGKVAGLFSPGRMAGAYENWYLEVLGKAES